jgi:ApbE superfamily uncharacterized protein (UPF0280 family)
MEGEGAFGYSFTHPTAPLAAAVSPLHFTPMAAVAGAVADEMLAAMVAGRTLTKAYVNDGGDIAVHLTLQVKN